MLRYNQKTGELWDGDQYMAKGYSGLGEYKNNPDSEEIKGLGVIPRGSYHIGPLYNSPNVGPDALPLEALPDTDTFGRGDFKIHGDSLQHPGAASHGCIIMPHDIRLKIASGGYSTLEVFVS